MPAKAQSSNHNQRIADIPFEFNVGNVTLPAGQYTITRVNPVSDRAALRVSSRYGLTSTLVLMNPVIGRTPESASLIFNRYGNRYFFAQAWTDGDNQGLQALKSRGERAIQRELAAIKPRIETVALMARAR